MKNKIYKSILDYKETEKAIKLIKDTFETKLSKVLELERVSAPLFVDPKLGLNDELSGKEHPISFKCDFDGNKLEIIQSLAKWKRKFLYTYKYKGIYTDMNAIRSHENLDSIHSLYVDQWDWEKIITKKDRNINYLKEIVNKIYSAFLETNKIVNKTYPKIKNQFSDKVTFITTEDLLNMYPNLSSKEREKEICKKFGTVFLIGIGENLSNGKPHDSRAADYDDWKLNGDLLVYYKELDIALELSSMGIRVDSDSLKYQLKVKHEEEKLTLPYHKDVIKNILPLTIGGGIGQSRLCMILLKKIHIGEVQSSYWPEKELKKLEKDNIKII